MAKNYSFKNQPLKVTIHLKANFEKPSKSVKAQHSFKFFSNETPTNAQK